MHTNLRYTKSKTAGIRCISALARRILDVQFVGVNLRIKATNLHHALTRKFLETFLNVAINCAVTPVAQGAYSQLWASAVSPDAKHKGYYSPVSFPAGLKAILSEENEQLFE